MEHFTPLASTIGGLLIGASATLMLLFTGRITGISGILAGVLTGSDRAWRLVFLVAMLLTGVSIYAVRPAAFGAEDMPSWIATLVAGLLVGVGTRLGSGCTSGHGVCGLARLSLRSLVATGTFMATGILTVWLLRHVLEVM